MVETSMIVAPFVDEQEEPAVRGFLHQPEGGGTHGLVLAHGAGSNCRAPLLVAVAEAFAAAGVAVLRLDLPFRQARPKGPPFPAFAARDQQGLGRAARVMRQQVAGRVFLGGHSYGGRQASMLAAAEPTSADALLLLSYPLHPPRRPADLRTAHLPGLSTPALFVHGTRDPFGSIEEMQRALTLAAGPVYLLPIEGAGHDLRKDGVAERTLQALREFAGI
jgi:predicted alpha/beta-hydrolase family hydrolase